MKEHSTPTPPFTHPTPPIAPAASASNGLAIASLVLGILSFTGFFLLTGIPAIITGALSLHQGQKERAMSIAGIIMGSIATLMSLVVILIIGTLMFVGMSQQDNGSGVDNMHHYDDSMPVDSTRT